MLLLLAPSWKCLELASLRPPATAEGPASRDHPPPSTEGPSLLTKVMSHIPTAATVTCPPNIPQEDVGNDLGLDTYIYIYTYTYTYS